MCGRSVAMAWAMYGQRWRGSRSPSRDPACENGWHGKPAVRMSTGSTWVQSTVVRSPWLGMPGNRASRILAGALSYSTCHATGIP